jgi:hypothetical protein
MKKPNQKVTRLEQAKRQIHDAQETLIGSFRLIFFNITRPSSLDGRMIGQILEPEGPELFANLTLWRVAVLV